MAQTIFDLPRYKSLGKKPLTKIFICSNTWLDPDRKENKWLQTGEPMYGDGWQEVEIKEPDPKNHKKILTIKGFWNEKRQDFIRPARNPERVMKVVASMGLRDRDKEVLEVAGWTTKNFFSNPAITLAHRTDQFLIGNAIRTQKNVKENQLLIWPEFTPGELLEVAETAFRNYRAAWMKAWSVHFDPVKWELGDYQAVMDGDENAVLMTYKKQDLVELAACGVGALPQALTAFEKTLGSEYKKILFAGYDQEELENAGEKEAGQDEYLKPYPNEHACRLADPKDFDRFARKNCERKHEGKCIDVIYGIKADKSKIQALRFPTDIWTEAQAKSYCKEQKGSFEAASGKETSCLERIESKLNAIMTYFGSDIIPRLDRLEKQRSGGANESTMDQETPEPEASDGKAGSSEMTTSIKAMQERVNGLFGADTPQDGELVAVFKGTTPRPKKGGENK